MFVELSSPNFFGVATLLDVEVVADGQTTRRSRVAVVGGFSGRVQKLKKGRVPFLAFQNISRMVRRDMEFFLSHYLIKVPLNQAPSVASTTLF